MDTSKPVVLVTGSSGLIGFQLCKRLAGKYSVVGLDRDEPPESLEQVDSILLNLTSDESVKEALRTVRGKHGNRLASVIHLAAYYNFTGEPSSKYEEVTVQGTRRLIQGLRSFEVEQFAFSSTMLVHAPCEPGQKINEDWPLEPKWDYPESKVETEKLIHAERNSICAAILRIAGVYDDDGHSIPIANQIQRIYERRLTSSVYPGDTSRGQSFIHLEDLLTAFLLLIERRNQLPAESVMLLGESETLSYDFLQRELGRLIHGEEWVTRQIPKTIAKTGAWVQDKIPGLEDPFIKPWMIDLADDHYELDISRARTLLKWEPMHSLENTLPKMTDALKADPVGWYRKNKLKMSDSLKEKLTREKAA